MKRHVSIFALLLSAFAAVGLTGTAEAGALRTYYKTPGGTFGGPNASVVNPATTTTPTQSRGKDITAYCPAGQKLAGWYYYAKLPSGSDQPQGQSLGTANPLNLKIEDGNDRWLCAHFAWITYNVKYDANGGSPTPQTVSGKAYNESFKLAAEEPTKTGYTFNKWKADTNENLFDPGATVTGADLCSSDWHENGETVTLRAQWTANPYSVTYEVENCTLTSQPSPGTYDQPLSIVWTKDADVGEKSTVTVYDGKDGTTQIKLVETTGTTFDFKMSDLGKGYYESVVIKVACTKNVRHDLMLKKGVGVKAITWKTNDGAWERSETDVNLPGLLASTTWAVKVEDNDVERGYEGPSSASGTMSVDVTREMKGTPHQYTVDYDLQEGTRKSGGHYPANATFDDSFCVSAPTRTDRTFLGWIVVTNKDDLTCAKWGTSSDDVTHEVLPETPYANGATGDVFFKNLTSINGEKIWLKAKWSGLTHTITVTTDPKDAGSASGGGEIEEGATAMLTATPNAGYSFCCWTNGNEVVSTDNPWTFTVTADATYTAVFTGNVVQVFFVDLHGGVAQPSSKLVTFGKPYGELATVKYGGLLEFSGWMDDDNNDVTANTKVTSTAKIQYLRSKPPTERNPIIIFADESYANTWVTNTTTTAGDPFPKPPEFSRDGYWPNGWVPALPEKATEDFTTYAQWTSLASVLDCEGSLWFAADKDSLWFVDSTDCKLGGTSLRANGPRGDGGSGRLITSVKEAGRMTFWWKGDAGTKLSVKSETEKFLGTFEGSDGMDWTPCTITIDAASSVIFYCSGTEFKGRCSVDYFTWTPGIEPTKYEVTFTDPSKTFTNETYWVEDGGTAVAPDWDLKTDKFESLAWSKPLSPITGVVTNEAVWTCRVEFVDREMSTTNRVVYGEKDVKEPELKPYPGYTHTGWNPALPAQVESNLVLTAVWTPNDVYTITYQPGAGVSGSQMVQSEKKGIAVNLYGKDKAYVRIGYSQDGWATADGGTKVFKFDFLYDFNVSTNLYPCWTNNRYTVTFDPNGGTVSPDTKIVEYGKTYGDLPEPDKRSGYEFVGWFIGDVEIKRDSTVATADNHALVAKWKQDMGEVSVALDCNNLIFEKTGGWTIENDHDFAYTEKGGNDLYLKTTSVDAGSGIFATVRESGTLTFHWRALGDKWDESELEIWMNNSQKIASMGQGNQDPGWEEKSLRIEVGGEPVSVNFVCTGLAENGYFAIDFVTWTPEGGGEPTPGDPVEVTAAGVANGVFSLTISAESGKDYGVWTNADLTVDSWGLMGKPQKGEGKPLEFKWTIIPGFPQLFFKAHKVEYK